MKKIKLPDDFRGATIAGLFLLSMFASIFTYGLSMVLWGVYTLAIVIFTESAETTGSEDGGKK